MLSSIALPQGLLWLPGEKVPHRRHGGGAVSLILRFCVTFSDPNVNNSEVLQGGGNL